MKQKRITKARRETSVILQHSEPNVCMSRVREVSHHWLHDRMTVHTRSDIRNRHRHDVSLTKRWESLNGRIHNHARDQHNLVPLPIDPCRDRSFQVATKRSVSTDERRSWMTRDDPSVLNEDSGHIQHWLWRPLLESVVRHPSSLWSYCQPLHKWQVMVKSGENKKERVLLFRSSKTAEKIVLGDTVVKIDQSNVWIMRIVTRILSCTKFDRREKQLTNVVLTKGNYGLRRYGLEVSRQVQQAKSDF